MRARKIVRLACVTLAVTGFACGTQEQTASQKQPEAVVTDNPSASTLPAESVIVRVPVDENGQEAAAKAEMRLTSAVSAEQGFDALVSAYDAGRAPEEGALALQGYNYGNPGYGNSGWNDHRGWGGRYDNYQPQYGYNNNRWTYNYNYSYSSPWYRNPYGYNRRPCHSGRYNYYHYRPQPGYGHHGGGWRR